MSTATSLSIAEAARESGLTAHTLRYYERAGLLDRVGRADSGHRRYDETDLAWIQVLSKLRATGMPMRDIRRYADLVRAGDGNEEERLALLEEHRDRVRAEMATVRRHLAFIERKVEFYRERMHH